MPRRVTVEVPAGAAGSRADRFMVDASGLSRAMVQKLIADGLLTADGNRMRSRDPVTPGALMELEVPDPRPETENLPEDIPLDIVIQAAEVLIVNKPARLVVHPAPGHPTGTLVNALLALDLEDGAGLATVGGVERPGIVHRLDRDTSGLLMVARTDAGQVGLQAQLKARRIHKRYLALVQGSVVAQLGRIEAPIGRDPKHRQRMAVVPDGRPSVTGYRVRERFREWTLVECDLVTGRTHQIRVHFASIGHQIAGDQVYATGAARRGPDGLERMFLHAWKLELVSPVSGDLVRAQAPLPDELEAVLASLRSFEERAD